jgi:hypothetical protein
MIAIGPLLRKQESVRNMVIPAEAGIQSFQRLLKFPLPAFSKMTQQTDFQRYFPFVTASLLLKIKAAGD